MAELARRLIAAGHVVTFAGPETGRPRIWPDGAENIKLPDYRLGGPAKVPLQSKWDHLPWRRRHLTNAAVASLPLRETKDLLARNEFDLVLVDFELHPHIILSLAASKKVALFSCMFVGPANVHAPPLDCTIVPGSGPSGTKIGIAVAWAALWARLRWSAFRRRLRSAGGDYSEVLQSLARTEGIALKTHTTRWRWQYPFAWHRLPLILIQGRELDFPQPRDPLIRYVGPMMTKPGVNTRVECAVLDMAKQAQQQGKRVVYIGFGSIMNQRSKLIVELWAALAKKPDWFVVHSLGGVAQPQLKVTPPPNVKVVDWVPQKALLEIADLAVIHAGINTIIECIEAEVPMLCIPQVNDQPGGAARVAFHGLGAFVPPDGNANAFLSKMIELIDNDDIRRRCHVMHQQFDKCQSDQVLERVVEQLLSEGAESQ